MIYAPTAALNSRSERYCIRYNSSRLSVEKKDSIIKAGRRDHPHRPAEQFAEHTALICVQYQTGTESVCFCFGIRCRILLSLKSRGKAVGLRQRLCACADSVMFRDSSVLCTTDLFLKDSDDADDNRRQQEKDSQKLSAEAPGMRRREIQLRITAVEIISEHRF